MLAGMATLLRQFLLVLLLPACGEIVPIPRDALVPDAESVPSDAPHDAASFDATLDAGVIPDGSALDPCEGPPVDAAGSCEAHDLAGPDGAPGDALTVGDAVITASGGSLVITPAGLGVFGGALPAAEPGESLLITFPDTFSAHLILDFEGAFWVRAGAEDLVLHDGYPSVYLPAGTRSVELLPAYGRLYLVRVNLNCSLC